MRYRLRHLSVVPFMVLAVGMASSALAFDPTTSYETREIEGWTVRVNKRLFADEELAKKTLALLGDHLRQIVRAVPVGPVANLKKVVIWVELDLSKGGMVYHPSEQWLKEHDFNPEKAKCVELSNARNFLNWHRDQPCMVLHEMAHAYHHQVLGYDHAGIKQCYEKATASKKYDQVLNINGPHQVHYAMNNDQEYFAEMTEAFFGTNDFYPFVRAELKECDPEMFAVLEDVWGVKKRGK